MSSPYQKFAYHTFGCKVNFADSCMIARELVNKGLTEVSINQNAEIYIINTCSVTNKADKKAERFIRKIYKRSPKSKIIVTGCYAQLNPNKISEIPGVFQVISAKNKFNINNYIDDENIDMSKHDINNVNDFNISYSVNERTRAFIKIQDGCDYICSYCTIPKARGKSRSSSIPSTIYNINKIIDSGVKEIILSGINVGDFGKDNNENLLQLLSEIEKIDKLKRYRISSIEPNLLNEQIIQLIAKSNKALPHLHIPLQSGSDKVLKSMKRRYTAKDYWKLINRIHRDIPGICIGVDVIVGYPNETDKDFIETYNFLDQLNISYLHVFSYSERKYTKSSLMKSQVTMEQKLYRRTLLKQLSDKKYKIYINNNLNQVREVLFENYNKGIVDGLTENYIRVYANGNNNLLNQVKKVKLLRNNLDVIGELID